MVGGKMNIEFDVTLQCNFSCQNCNRHSNFNDLSSPLTGGKENQVGMDLYDSTDISIQKTKEFIQEVKDNGKVAMKHMLTTDDFITFSKKYLIQKEKIK